MALRKRWTPDRDFILGTIRKPPFRRFRLEHFPYGLDSERIDVLLDPYWVEKATTLVRSVLREDVQRHFWKSSLKASGAAVREVFNQAYIDLSQVVNQHARAGNRPERAQLYLLAVYKLLLTQVGVEFDDLRQELMNARSQPAKRQSGQSLQLHERSVILSRFESEIRFRTLKDIMQLVMRLERSSIRNRRKSVLGMSWPLPEEMLATPLVYLAGCGSGDDFAAFFPYLLYDNDRAAGFFNCIFETFADWLPDGLDAGSGSALERPAIDRGGAGAYTVPGLAEIEGSVYRLVGERERETLALHPFDNAEAVVGLLGGLGETWPDQGEWREERLLPEMERRFKTLVSKLKQTGLIEHVVASSELRAMYPDLGLHGAVEPLYDYLLGKLSRRQFPKRLAAIPGVDDPEAAAERLELLHKTVRAGKVGQRDQVLQCVRDAMSYRYKLKLAWWMLDGMDNLNLLSEDRDIEMSRVNGLLQRFTFSMDEEEDEQATPVGHVIIKAAISGVTELTTTMRTRKLNPATHFSRYVFDPINQLIESFGAEKVLVGGNAIVLAIIEQSGGERFAVARACGLARRILEVSQRNNVECKRLDLPSLELGMGIAYAEQAPTYLYDNNQGIMISPAINHADLLSSCDTVLRGLIENSAEGGGLDVLAEVSATEASSGVEKLRRYNVNGIELEAQAFSRLETELKLHKLALKGERGVFHVGRYPDQLRNTHWLIVREAPVRLLIGSQLLEQVHEGRHFYAVVTDPSLRARIQKRLAGRRS